MEQAKTLSVGGIGYEVIDDTARSNAQTALNNTEYNRQGQIGKYGGQNIATILAGEIGSGSVYDALHKRAANGNFAGLRVGDYIDVPLVSASGVAAQQSVRFLWRTSTRTTAAATAPKATTSPSWPPRPSPWPRP